MSRKIIIALVGVLVLAVFIAAKWEESKPKRNIAYQENLEWQVPEEDSLYRNFFQKLEAYRTGRSKAGLKILQMGDSHIQADFFTHKLRQEFIKWLQPDYFSRGLIFPYQIAETNNPYNYKVDYSGNWTYKKNTKIDSPENIGLSGISLSTSDAKFGIKIRLRDTLFGKNSIHRICIHHNDSTYGYHARILDEAFKGKISNEKGRTCIEFPEKVNEFHVQFQVLSDEDEKPAFELYSLNLENDNPAFAFSSLGVNGASFATYLKSKLWAKELKAYRPDLFIISLGTNDAFYPKFKKRELRKQIKQFLDLVEKNIPGTPVVLTTPGDCLAAEQIQKRVFQVRNEILKQALKRDMAVWDFYQLMGGKGSMQKWKTDSLAARDGVHLSVKGYRKQGTMFMESFKLNNKIYTQDVE